MAYCNGYTCTPLYTYVVLLILSIVITVVTTLILYFSNSISDIYSTPITFNSYGIMGSISGIISSCILFIICIGFLALLCPTKPGRIVLWILVACTTCTLICNVISAGDTIVKTLI